LSDVWGYDSIIDTRTVDTHMRRLRDKLGSCGRYIETVRGFGYRLAVPHWRFLGTVAGFQNFTTMVKETWLSR